MVLENRRVGWCRKPHTSVVRKKISQRGYVRDHRNIKKLKEPTEVDTRHAFMRAIPLNDRIKARIWRAVELMGREETRTMIVITNHNGGLSVPGLP